LLWNALEGCPQAKEEFHGCLLRYPFMTWYDQ
jgi:hypothetical protein